MSTKAKKTTNKTTAPEAEGDVFVRELPDDRELRLSLAIDLEEMFTLVQAIRGIDDDADMFETLDAVRTIMPEEFLKQVKGVDVAISLSLFMEWVNEMGDRLGKAFTSSAD